MDRNFSYSNEARMMESAFRDIENTIDCWIDGRYHSPYDKLDILDFLDKYTNKFSRLYKMVQISKNDENDETRELLKAVRELIDANYEIHKERLRRWEEEDNRTDKQACLRVIEGK